MRNRTRSDLSSLMNMVVSFLYLRRFLYMALVATERLFYCIAKL